VSIDLRQGMNERINIRCCADVLVPVAVFEALADEALLERPDFGVDALDLLEHGPDLGPLGRQRERELALARVSQLGQPLQGRLLLDVERGRRTLQATNLVREVAEVERLLEVERGVDVCDPAAQRERGQSVGRRLRRTDYRSERERARRHVLVLVVGQLGRILGDVKWDNERVGHAKEDEAENLSRDDVTTKARVAVLLHPVLVVVN
jgi:hypothetical protein